MYSMQKIILKPKSKAFYLCTLLFWKIISQSSILWETLCKWDISRCSERDPDLGFISWADTDTATFKLKWLNKKKLS